MLLNIRSRKEIRALFFAPGFTLVELLVTIGVIAILGGLAFPVYSRVSATAERAECTNRMRTVGMAILLFEGDQGRLPGPTEDGYFMAPGNGGIADSLVREDFIPAEGDHWFCPSNRPFQEAGISFAINNSASTNPPYLFGEQTGSDSYSSGRSIAQIKDNLTTLWLLSDIDGANFSGGGSGDGAPVFGANPAVSSASAAGRQKEGGKASNLSSVGAAHSGRRNYLFFDGHLEILSSDAWPTARTTKGNEVAKPTK